MRKFLSKNDQSNSKFFYTATLNGGLKQFSYDDQSLINDFVKPLKNYINVMVKTHDEKYLYIACVYGWLYQWSIEENKAVKDFGKAHSSDITSMEITKNGEYQLTGDANGDLKK